ncbi:MAG: hypothetical protein D6805_09625 [Planctomycetota bacterium]|nr:MAG: hypothetical protein D6805_09625 [Planctomycetota bacterium]
MEKFDSQPLLKTSSFLEYLKHLRNLFFPIFTFNSTKKRGKNSEIFISIFLEFYIFFTFSFSFVFPDTLVC